MITNQQIKLIGDSEANKGIKLEWEWTGTDGELNVYLQKFQEDKLEKLGTILQVGGLAYAEKIYKMEKRGLYRIVVFPVVKGKEQKESKIETDYICIGGKNTLEYSFEDADDMSCRCINIKRLDRPIQKDLVYLCSISDKIKIPFTDNLSQGQKFYIANGSDLNLEIKYPYSLEVEKRRV